MSEDFLNAVLVFIVWPGLLACLIGPILCWANERGWYGRS
jgi:hypothetical protein